ncbi:acyltransferase family protein [Arthrobacter cavernae]|uniref:Acyltransferase family protein n=1 Tax=Arthrobacter cavernae TaxID=2817681 RepID=A0A939KJY6_9MICC|nr:acyltransferase family protein [Arthrobacter cavernae]MBO1269172.1 acyltransferase family protein [Arthrobacter cavernae]
MLDSLLPARRQSSNRKRQKQLGSKKVLRPDIQGLRTFAVVAVVLDHLLDWPSGGFVGVDIFFVISGFLITGLLLREQERTGTISFTGFYKRRAKRILPASLLVLVVTVVVSYFVFGWSRFVGVVWDGLAAALFAGNWRFAAVGTDYFQADGPVSPLQHYWSLAVEEQFYFVWPWIMLLVFVMVARRSGQGAARAGAGVAIVVISVASFAWALWESQNNNGVAYFSTFSRTWELGIGAIIAVVAPALTRIPRAIRPLLAWVGISGMVLSLFAVENGPAFPAPFAALPVLSAALVIIAGTGTSEHRFIWPLTNKVSGYIGDISFSLYLWHFPVIIIGSQIVDGSTPLGAVQLAAFFLATSIYSYHLVEDPIRKSRWLDGGKRHRKHADRAPVPGSYKITALSALGCLTAIMVVPLLVPGKPVAEPVALPVVAAPLADTASAALPPGLAKLQAEIRASVGAAGWPELSPSMDEAIAGGQAPADILECGKIGRLVDEEACTWGSADASKTAVVIGDSTSMGYVAGIRSLAELDPTWRVKSYGTFGCAYSDVPNENVEADCAARKEDAVNAINRIRPDIVFITNHYNERTPEGVNRPLTQAEKASSVEAFVSKFQASAGKIVFIAPAPADKNIATCYTKVSTPATCMNTITSRWVDASVLEKALAEKLGGSYMDSRDWFCADAQCPVFVGTTPVKRDLAHATPEYQARISPVILEALRTAKIV